MFRQFTSNSWAPRFLSACTATLLLLASPLGQAQTQAQAMAESAQIQVSGLGEIRAAPDTALVSFTFAERSRDSAQAKKLVDTQVNNLLKLTQRLDIAEADVNAARLNVYPEYDYQNNRTLIGYQVSREVQVRVRKLDNYPALLDGAVGIGASNTHQQGFEFSNRTELENQAMLKAFEHAKAKAELLAAQAGGKLGKTLWIAESGSYNPPMPMRMQMFEAKAADTASYPTGELELQKQVDVRFELLPR